MEDGHDEKCNHNYNHSLSISDVTNELPEDIWVNIMSFLTMQELGEVSTISQKWKKIADHFSLWENQYIRLRKMGNEIILVPPKNWPVATNTAYWKGQLRNLMYISKFITVRDFSSKKSEFFSPNFFAIGCWWNLKFFFPWGNNSDGDLSLYLHFNKNANAVLPVGWYKNILFSVVLFSDISDKIISRCGFDLFCEEKNESGFTHYLPLAILHDRSNR